MSDGYDSLRAVLARAVEQASAGKGRVRHAHDEPFDEQKIVLLAKWTGGPAFDVGQACKKALESTRLPKDRAVAELLGAINYLAAAVIVLEGEQLPTKAEVPDTRRDTSTEHSRTRCAKPIAGRPPYQGFTGTCLDRQGHVGACTVGYACKTHGLGCTLELNVCEIAAQATCGEIGPWSSVAGGRGCDKPKGHGGLHRLTVTQTGWEVKS